METKRLAGRWSGQIVGWLCGLLLASLPRLVADDRPNILLILADDLGYETLQMYGGESYDTPQLDRLARRGLRFDRAYAMPLCTNTRIQLMTGRYNLRNWEAFGILGPQARTFGHAMQAAGYRTCMAGKWQLTSYDPPDYPGAAQRRNTGMRPEDAGFDTYSLWHVGHTENKGSRYADPHIVQDGQPIPALKDAYGPDVWTNYLCNFMESAAQDDQPFFAYYAMALPHNPMNPTPDSPEWKTPALRQVDETRFAKDMIEYTDKLVGVLVNKIDQLGIADETLVLFYSDNGTNARVRSHFRGRSVGGEKGLATELGCRVPMIACWPGVVPAGTTTSALIDSCDFFPTLVELSGATDATSGADDRELSAANIDGISFARLLQEPTTPHRDHVLIHQDPRPGWDKDRFKTERVAIGHHYKLYEDGRLFDLDTDFYEHAPIWIATDRQHERTAREQLQAVLDAHSVFRLFDPDAVPREDPRAHRRQFAFPTFDGGNIAIIEAEEIPFWRDESWTIENSTPGHAGSGYLRCLRTQQPNGNTRSRTERQLSVPQGQALVRMKVENTGHFRLAARVRYDWPATADSRERQPVIAVRTDTPSASDPGWKTLSLPASAQPGQWHWIELDHAIELNEGQNEVAVAPLKRNWKIDRLVVYRPEAREKALAPNTPASMAHPW